MNSLHHQVRNPGNKATTTPQPCLASPLCHVLTPRGDDLPLHACSHKSPSVDVPERLDLPKQQGRFIDCLLVSDRGRGFCFCSLGLSDGLCELDNILPFGLCRDSDSLVSSLSLCLHTVYLDENTKKILTWIVFILMLSVSPDHV